MSKMKCILLVDDDQATNFLNELLLNDLGVSEQVHVVWDGQEALDYIALKGKYKNKDRTGYPVPDLIFLDINMPLMDGFEFLENFKKMPMSKKINTRIVFLTTTILEENKQRFRDNELVFSFTEKPLKKDALLKIVEAYKEYVNV